jgi:AraC-like DNA-binding protein
VRQSADEAEVGAHRYLSRSPGRALEPFISAIWYFEGAFPHHRERIIPNGEISLHVNLADDELRSYHGDDLSELRATHGAALTGACAEPFGIDTAEQRSILGVSFKPGGALPFFRPPASETVEEHVALDALWGRDGALVRERLLEADGAQAKLAVMEKILTEALVRPLLPDACVEHAVSALERGMAVQDVVDRVGLSMSTFKRRFVTHVGLTPKRFARVRRFQRVITEVAAQRPACWASLALRHGYFDQAHLIRDFHRFAGVSPTQYGPRAPGEASHVAIFSNT